ncbi:MAG: carboxypeptidase-like regulatory domain-containing protein [Planctomycetia bacterium]|nr:carboxypeptidase-like regulatory domain-containing protein [Planctomycetia bacterium]
MNRAFFFLNVGLFLSFTLFICDGCGSPSRSRPGLVKASGSVVYNGQPVAGANVMFYPETSGPDTGAASAITDAEGKFELMTDSPKDGALPGKYKITVNKQAQYIDGILKADWEKQNTTETGQVAPYDKDKIKTEYLVPQRYSTLNSSPLVQEIPAGGIKEIKIELSDD